MRAVILCSGSIDSYAQIRNSLRPDDVFICADGGYRHAVALGITPRIVLGDMDSVQNEIIQAEVKRYPCKKDYTDGEIAVHYVIEHEFDEALLLGCIGTRMDHTLTNIFLLSQLLKAGIHAVLLNEKNEIYMTDTKIEINGQAGDAVSIIPVTPAVCIAYTKGLEYDAAGLTLYYGTSLGNSNCMTEPKCTVCVDSGICLVIKSMD